MSEAMAIDAAAGDTSTASMPSSSNRPNLDGILLLEAPFAKVPFDELRRQQKTQQRLIERELLFCSSTLNDLSKLTRSASSDAAKAELDKSLDIALGRLRGLKRKLAPLADQAKISLRMAQSRIDHLNILHNFTDSDSPDFTEWSKTRLDRMLVDYMLRKGYRSTASDLAAKRGIQDLVDTELFAEIAKVEDSLCPPRWNKSNHVASQPGDVAGASSSPKPSCALALQWCSENKASLRKIKTPLEFNLRLQEFIELTRVRTPENLKEAIAYSRKYLAPLVNPSALPYSASNIAHNSTANSANKTASGTAGISTSTSSTNVTSGNTTSKEDAKDQEYERQAAAAITKQVLRSMGLLACSPTTTAQQHQQLYWDLYNLDRWQMLKDSFRSCALQIHSLPPQPILHIALSAGLSSLKLPACYASNPNTASAVPGNLGGKAKVEEGQDALNQLLMENQLAGEEEAISISNNLFPPALGGASSGPEPGSSAAATAIELLIENRRSNKDQSSSSLSASKSANDHKEELDPATDLDPRKTGSTQNIDCPICDHHEGLGRLAIEVPWSHHQNSTLVCSFSGRMMDDNNPPLALPNGRIYSQSTIIELANQSLHRDTITCPRTKQVFGLGDIRKVFIS